MVRCCKTARPVPASLKAAGLKRTAPREALLQVLENSDRPLRVEEIRQALAEPRPGVPTLYRNLQRFVDEGWVEVLAGPDQAWRYVRCLSQEHHHHIQCQSCGRMGEVEGCGLESALQDLEARSGFQILHHQLTLHGLCPDCQRNSRKPAP